MDKDEEVNQYNSFLRSLDNDSFISHISSLSQGHLQVVRSQDDHLFQAISTPTAATAVATASFNSAVSSDPFDDSVDEEQLARIAKGDDDNNNSQPLPDQPEQPDQPVGQLHQFGDYATYFRSKHLKQQHQDAEYLEWERQRLKTLPKPIFKDCTIFVNGHTTPSINEIHRLVVLHGGKFISYLVNKSSASHIICDWLTPRKSEMFRNCRVVKAKWIVDCIEKEELLDWKEYRLIKEVAYDQQRLQFETLIEQQPEEEEPDEEEEDNDDEYEIADDDDDNGGDNDIPVLLDTIPEGRGVHKIKDKYVLDARHPDFLAKFFANSRLHHLSMWKADLRLKFLRKIISEKPITKSQSTDSDKIIMHIDFDCFFATASCLSHTNLDIESDPIAVSHGSRTSDVASCNYVARSFGVKNGMWLTQAKQLCPQIKIIDYDFPAYEKYSNEFYNYLISCDCFDSIFPVSIDEVLVDVSTYGSNQSIEELCKTIRKDVFTLTKCPVSIGVSSNVLLAKLSLRHAKPNGYYHLQSSEVPQFLQSVKISNLPGIGPSISEKLSHELNLPTSTIKVSDVLPVSQSRLVTLFGEKTGAKLYQYSRGIDETSLSTPLTTLDRKSVSVDVNFGIRFDKVEELDDFLIRLSKELYTRLINLGFCGSSLTLRLARRSSGAPINPPKFLGMGRCDMINKSSRLGVPTNDWGVIGNEAKVLYRMVNIPVTELRGVGLSLTKLVDVDSVKRDRQARLEFKKGNIHDQFKDFSLPSPPAKIQMRTPSPKKRLGFTRAQFEKQSRVSSNNGLDNIDWDVFESLPDDIKKELERELTRRGMVSVKRDSNTKAYLQQLLPTQSGTTNYVRVIETSPTKRKSPKKPKLSPVKLSPLKKQYEPSQSYDSSVIAELPSSIRNSVLKDVEYINKVKVLDMMPMRDKLHLLEKQRQVKVKQIDLDWISTQNKLTDTPMFLNQKVSITELETRFKEWINMSLTQGGPHEDDIKYLGEYLDEMLKMNDVTRVMLLRKCIETNLELHKSTVEFIDVSERQFILEGIEDWNYQLSTIIDPKLKVYR
ncbi:DNA repair protein REV1 [Spathaspora sp. JA1]|nr:DNA repair protein REV1 [Spathaspora sp. JA1]